ncbi:MAG: hypothetical protein R6U40_02220, partial [Desulfobacterales bacterium]
MTESNNLILHLKSKYPMLQYFTEQPFGDLGLGGGPKKGKRMAGRMGAARRTARNCRLVAV